MSYTKKKTLSPWRPPCFECETGWEYIFVTWMKPNKSIDIFDTKGFFLLRFACFKLQSFRRLTALDLSSWLCFFPKKSTHRKLELREEEHLAVGSDVEWLLDPFSFCYLPTYLSPGLYTTHVSSRHSSTPAWPLLFYSKGGKKFFSKSISCQK